MADRMQPQGEQPFDRNAASQPGIEHAEQVRRLLVGENREEGCRLLSTIGFRKEERSWNLLELVTQHMTPLQCDFILSTLFEHIQTIPDLDLGLLNLAR
jgi:hypothetical protein